ncbi:MAG TPA: hypothetical protein VGZ69_04855 [Candidatus Rhabdochlamydia sp.]|jgi:hypothetical protein|nr:hypothetical protein [Candidatus Rhabdochlamydia sp.]
MSVFITSITELSRNFFHLDPFKYDEYFAITPFFQKHCPNASLLHRVCLIPVKVIHDGPIHAPAAVVKTIMAIVKSIFAILLEVFGIEIDYRTPFKQGLAHLVLGVIHLIEAPLSLIPNTHKIHLLYLDRISKIKNSLAKFLETSNKGITIKYVADPNLEEQLRVAQEELKIRDADFDQLEQDIERTAKNLKEPSQCEKIVDRSLLLSKKAILEKVRNINKTARQPITTHKEIKNEKITNSLMQNEKSVVTSKKHHSFEDVDDLLEKIPTPSNTDILATIFSESKNSKEEVQSAPREYKNSNKNFSSNSSHPSQKSSFALRKEYSENLRNRSKKPQLANS